MLLIPIPLRTPARRLAATIIFLGLLAAGYVWVATRAPGQRRPRGVWEWATTILVVAIELAIFRWVVQVPRRLMQADPTPSIRRPLAKRQDATEPPDDR